MVRRGSGVRVPASAYRKCLQIGHFSSPARCVRGAREGSWGRNCGQAEPNQFAGASPGRPIGELALGRRLRRLGVSCGRDRRAALLELSGELSAPVLADLLGIHANTAANWAELAGRHQAGYLALRQSG
jgi:hypothetical protein